MIMKHNPGWQEVMMNGISELTSNDQETQSASILVIEDDVVLGSTITRGLSETGYKCRLADLGRKAEEMLVKENYDVIILDLMLPDVSGIDLLKKIRTNQIDTPVLILTALGSVEDRVNGLNAGADDYLVKPFAFVELTARLEAIQRRSNKAVVTKLKIGELTMELTTRKVERAGRQIDLTPTEFKLLEFLMRNTERVVTRQMMCEHLWESNWEGVTNVIEVHINRLRTKINLANEPQMIHTVRGSGYVLRPT